MNKHIWYRLEYKRAVDRGIQVMVGIIGLMFLQLLVGVLVGVGETAMFLPAALLLALLVCDGAVIITLAHVDKHEWELTKNQKGGQTK